MLRPQRWKTRGSHPSRIRQQHLGNPGYTDEARLPFGKGFAQRGLRVERDSHSKAQFFSRKDEERGGREVPSLLPSPLTGRGWGWGKTPYQFANSLFPIARNLGNLASMSNPSRRAQTASSN